MMMMMTLSLYESHDAEIIRTILRGVKAASRIVRKYENLVYWVDGIRGKWRTRSYGKKN